MTKKVIAVVLSVMMLVGCCLSVNAASITVSGSSFKATLDQVDDFMAGKTPAQRKTIYDFLEVYLSTDAGIDTLIDLVDDQSEVSQLIKDYIAAFGVSDADKATLKMYLKLLQCVPTEVRRKAVEDWHDRVGYAGYDAGASYAAGVSAIRGYLFSDDSTYTVDGATDAVFYQLLYNLRDVFVLTADAKDTNFDYEFYAFTNNTFKTNLEGLLVAEALEINGTSVTSAKQLMTIFCDIINDDTNITPQMKRNIAETLKTTNSFKNKTQGTIVVPSNPSGSGTGSGAGIGAGAGTSNPTLQPAQPNMYPAIPDPSKVGFVTVNGSTNTISGQKTTFDDVTEHWSKDYVEVLATAGFLHGHSETDYKPDLGVTREEMAVILARVLGVEGQQAANISAFNDHASIQSYAVDAVYKMVEMGIYKGYGEGSFAPQQILTREEISALFSRIVGKANLKQNDTFGDHHEIAAWFVADVENLVNYGIINGYPDDSFRPQNNVTRAEAAVMLYNTLYRLGILK